MPKKSAFISVGFKFKQDTIDKLDAVAAHLASQTGMPVSKTAALVFLINEASKNIPEKNRKGS